MLTEHESDAGIPITCGLGVSAERGYVVLVRIGEERPAGLTPAEALQFADLCIARHRAVGAILAERLRHHAALAAQLNADPAACAHLPQLAQPAAGRA
ncbi:hypothetical protein [Methylobacterium sp. WSM2598]|uniref:hypothetical protein n=1 Tax=Methylobacterium sp. WSM2598 TaxID=398261 RepID=UPI00035D9D36|nr:hypothetical protein [Methylobacterium sp. WSM2598]